MKNPITTAVAVLALFTGGASLTAGVLNQRAADRKVCAVQTNTNASVRGLLDDFISSDPHATVAERNAADGIALARFPKNPC